MNTQPPYRFLVVVLAMAMLAGCGRAGAPYKPSEAAAKQAKENEQPAPPAPAKQDKRFILDGLLN